tara:strand:- start:279 stop:668 length:390 start_codon:yes stop_codon:yes gene_type:complete
MDTLYNKLHEAIIKETGLKEGDTVKILRKAKSGELGWENTWNVRMNDYVGGEYEVNTLSQYGVTLVGRYYTYPIHILEIVKVKVELPVFDLKDGYEVKVQEDGSLVVGCQKVSNDLLNKITDAANKVKG